MASIAPVDFIQQTLIKSVQQCSNNKEVYLSMMKGHLKRMWVQYMSSWLMEQGLQDPEEAESSKDRIGNFLQYPVLEAASDLQSVHLPLKVYFLLFHTLSLALYIGL